MVTHQKRDTNDIFAKPILGFLFKNKTFLLVLRIAVAALFFYAILYGFLYQGKENLFTGAVFWGIFWALFMVSTLPTFGRIFCGICPHGFLGKYIGKFGLQHAMPQWMQNRYIGITLLVVGWWGVYYTFPFFWKSPLATAAMFGGMTLIAFVFYFLYKEMSYCKYICPIGTLTRAYDKLSFTKLETYTASCAECRTFECAEACPYALKPFSFAKKNQADDCTLCMACAASCEAVKFSITKPSEQLFSKFKTLPAEVWTYILILGAIPVSMGFAHGLNRTKIADSMIWNKTAAYLGMSEYAGGFAFLYALMFTAFFAVLGLFLAAKVLKKEYASTFASLGYAYAPLFILGSLGHALGGFFTHDYQEIVAGFAQAFGMSLEVAPLAKRGDAWLGYFELLKWLGVLWALVLLYKRLKLVEASRLRKVFAYFFASFLILFFIGTNIYRGYIFKTYGSQERGAHAMHQPNTHDDASCCSHTLEPLGIESLGADKLLYFSLSDPAQNAKGGMHGGHMPSKRGSIPEQKVWLLGGSGYLDAAPVAPETLRSFYLDTAGTLHPLKPNKNEEATHAYTFAVPKNGYYNLYALDTREIAGVNITRVAKLEHLRGSHASEERYEERVKKSFLQNETPIDLIRIKNDEEESFFYTHAMGDLLKFQALFEGKPLAGAQLHIALQSGWSKTVRTDAQGKASFRIIRDYFPDTWDAFEKRRKGEMLLTLRYMPSKERSYVLTYPLSYYPAPSDYQSYAYALLLFIITLAVSGYVVYRYRRNRTKPFSEVAL